MCKHSTVIGYIWKASCRFLHWLAILQEYFSNITNQCRMLAHKKKIVWAISNKKSLGSNFQLICTCLNMARYLYIKSFESTSETWVRVFQTRAKFTYLSLFGKKVFNFTNKSLNNTDKLGLRMIIYNLWCINMI